MNSYQKYGGKKSKNRAWNDLWSGVYNSTWKHVAYSGNRSLAFSNDVGKELDEGIQSTAAKLTSCRLEAQIDNNPKPPVKENQMFLR